MRTSLISFCTVSILSFSLPVTAQQRPNTARKFVYANLSVGIGSPFAYKASLACLFHHRHEVSFGYSYYERKALDIPDDYSSYDQRDRKIYPHEAFRGLELFYGRVLYLKRPADRVRFVLRSGLLIGQQSTPHDFQIRPTPVSYGVYWSYQTRERTTVAVTFHPTMDFTPGRTFGISAGLYAIVSEDFNGGGMSIGCLLGRVRNKTQAQH